MPMAATSQRWTLDQLHSLPDDGNKYELVRGELFVTPAPTRTHESILARLTRILDPYVAAHSLGYVFHPRAVVRFDGSETEPDLLVRKDDAPELDWEAAPTPSLVVEVLSPSTRRRDRVEKRQFYLDAGAATYWIVDADARTVTVVRHRETDLVARETVDWHPAGASAELTVRLNEVFGAS